jgi:hypothetical protein
MNIAHPSNAAERNMQKAYEDLWTRTLSKFAGDLNRLVYLASTRDYNSGKYHHAGLEVHFGIEAVQRALERAHREVFGKLTRMPLKDLVSEFALYMHSSVESPDDILHAWRTLQPYRIAIPIDVDPQAANLLLSNIKLALEVLHNRRGHVPGCQ